VDNAERYANPVHYEVCSLNFRCKVHLDPRWCFFLATR
jgi:hypothetical protein